MKILLTHSYFLKKDPKELMQHKPYPPLASLTLAGWIKEKLNIDVEFYDVMFDDSEWGLINKIQEYAPDVLIVYDDDFNFLTKMCLENMRLAIVNAIQKSDKTGLFIIHGSDASDHAALYLYSGFDVVVHRNAEKVILNLLQGLTRNDWQTVVPNLKSISARINGRIVQTGLETENLPLGEFPFPRWDLIDLAPYREMWQEHHGYFSLNISTSQGCPYGCNWCAKPLYGRVYRSLPPEKVAEQIRILHRELRADHIWITDDIFALKPGWIETFTQELKMRGLRVPYKCLSRADLINEKFSYYLKESGCEEVWMGVESGSQKILDAMEKGIRVEHIHTAVSHLRRQKIKVGFFIQYGYLGETYADIQQTLRLIRHCVPDYVGISVSYPLKGTPFYERVVGLMGSKHNWKDSGDLALLYSGTYHSQFYRHLYRFTHHFLGIVSVKRRDHPYSVFKRFLKLGKHLPGALKQWLFMQKYLKAGWVQQPENQKLLKPFA